jgi:hypothetical protein
MVTYWVKEESLFLPRAQLMQKLVKNLTSFFLSEPLLSLAFEIPQLMHLGLPVGFSTFIPPSFPVTLTNAPFDKSRVNNSLAPSPLVILIHFLWCCSAASERP